MKLKLVCVAALVAFSSIQAGGGLTGKLSFFAGKVTVNGKKAKLGQSLKKGDKIKVGKKSVARINLGAKNVISMRAQSSLVLGKKAGYNEVFVKKGALLAVLKKKSDLGKFRIRTPTAVAGVRGTSLYTNVRSKKSTYFCLCNGKITLTPGKKGKPVDVEAGHHNAHTFTKKGKKISMQKAGMEEHEDSQLDALATGIGEKVPWTD